MRTVQYVGTTQTLLILCEFEIGLGIHCPTMSYTLFAHNPALLTCIPQDNMSLYCIQKIIGFNWVNVNFLNFSVSKKSFSIVKISVNLLICFIVNYLAKGPVLKLYCPAI